MNLIYVQASRIVRSGRVATMSVASPDQAHGGVLVTMEARLIVRFCYDDCGIPVEHHVEIDQAGAEHDHRQCAELYGREHALSSSSRWEGPA